jgi:hypothetical protein
MIGKLYTNFITELTMLSCKYKKTPKQIIKDLKKKISDEIAQLIAKIEESPALNNYSA